MKKKLYKLNCIQSFFFIYLLTKLSINKNKLFLIIINLIFFLKRLFENIIVNIINLLFLNVVHSIIYNYYVFFFSIYIFLLN